MNGDESIVKLGALVKEIYFKQVPDSGLLNELCEESDDIRIHLPLNKPLYLHEYSESSCSGNIISANFETDIFTDSEELFKLSNLENLILTCNRADIEKLDDKDINNTKKVIRGLKPLKSLVFDVTTMEKEPAEQIINNMCFVGFDTEVRYTDRNISKSKKKCRTSIVIKGVFPCK